MPDETPWIKAPDLAESPKAREALRAETGTETQEFLTAGLRPLRCEHCGTSVLVRKTSAHQTSVQWPPQAKAGCEELAAPSAPAGCAALAASIARAVADGRIEVGR